MAEARDSARFHAASAVTSIRHQPPATMNTRRRHEKLLLEATALPTAAGEEAAVVDFVQRWARRRKGVTIRRDRLGNLMLGREGPRSRRPIIFTAHMDHPCFVVTGPGESKREVRAQFRGGVGEAYFVGSTVRLRDRSGRITSLDASGTDKAVVARFGEPVAADAGDVMPWALDPPVVKRGRLHAPACDDLAGLAAALAAFESLGRRKGIGDVRVLLTRCEEVGLIGAIGACRGRFIPRGARLFALENSRSFADSPIGGGPIVRVGDRASTFDPDLTHRAGRLARAIAAGDDAFRWQRKLMPGGTCEASAFQALGYDATCLCLPLGNYHNMDQATGKIAAEVISLDDYHGLIRLLVAIGQSLDDPDHAPSLGDRLGELFASRRHLLR